MAGQGRARPAAARPSPPLGTGSFPPTNRSTRVLSPLLIAAGGDPAAVGHFHFKHGQGCGRCRGTGYRGRTAIAEILLLDDQIRQLIIDRQAIALVKEAARKRGLHFLRESAVALVAAGKTTLQEINRVTFVA